MRLDREHAARGPVVAAIGAGGFRIGEHRYAAALLTPEAVRRWTPPPLAALDAAALAPLLALTPRPEFLLLGTGARLDRPAPALTAAIAERAIGLEVMDSRAAARAWGVLRNEDRWIVAALYPLDA